MNNFSAQIVRSYEELHLDLATIAREMECGVTEIKVILNNYSSVYREDCKDDKELDFTDSELVLANRTIVNAVKSDDENLAFRAAKYVRDDKKGRRDIKSGMRNVIINVMEFNEQLRRMQLSVNNPGPVGDEKKVIEV